MATWGNINSQGATSALSTPALAGSAAFPENGTLVSVHLFLDGVGASNLRCALFSSATGSPTTVALVEDLGEIASPTSGGWNDFNTATAPSLAAGTFYWIAHDGDSGSIRRTSSGVAEDYAVAARSVDSGGSGGWPSTVDIVSTFSTVRRAYLVYTPTAGGTGLAAGVKFHLRKLLGMV